MFDKIELAKEYSEAIGDFSFASHHQTPTSKVQYILSILNSIFPWLDNFVILRDGSDLRWRACNALAPDSDVVFSRLNDAKRQVRDWIIEYVDRQRDEPSN